MDHFQCNEKYLGDSSSHVNRKKVLLAMMLREREADDDYMTKYYDSGSMSPLNYLCHYVSPNSTINQRYNAMVRFISHSYSLSNQSRCCDYSYCFMSDGGLGD